MQDEEWDEFDNTEDINYLKEEYDLDDEDAEEVHNLISEGLDEEEAVELHETLGGTYSTRDSGGGNIFGSLIVLGLLIWGGVTVWGWVFGESDSNTENYSSPTPFHSEKNCVEPENPYNEGSGHYAGWQWGEEGNSCDGNSSSFIEGCEEYESAESDYEQCLQN